MPNVITVLFPSSLAGPLNFLLNSKQWYPSPHRAISPRPWFLPMTLSAFIASSLLPRTARLSIATPILLLLLIQTRVTSTNDVAKDFGRAAFVFGWVLKWIDFGMMVKDGEIWHVKDSNSQEKNEKELDEDKENERNANLWQRLKDEVELWIFNMRGIGWNWRVGGIPDRAPQSKP
jgi:hypothetical protein